MEYLSHAIVFIEYDNRLFTCWRHFTHFQNPLTPKRCTDWAKSRPDCGVLLCESSVQVPLVQRIRNVNRILALCKERFPMNSLFASNIIYSFQIFAWTLFLVIPTEFA